MKLHQDHFEKWQPSPNLGLPHFIGSSRGPWIVCVLLVLVTLLAYSPVRYHEFLVYDDPGYVTENPMVRAGLTWAGVKWAFTTTHASDWQPLTWLSHMLDCQLFGLDAGKHHLVNVFLHTTNAVLLFLLLLRLTGARWQSALVAALFAWHPLRVESVAWVAERKGVLCALFGLLALTAYVRYAQKREQAKAAPVDYGLALLFFGLGLMAKPVLVTLPLAFLLLDYWPLQRSRGFEFRVSRWPRLALEKWPFFALSAASCVVTFIVMQRSHSLAPLESHPLPFRIENAFISYANYLVETIWATKLTLVCLLPREIPWVQALAAAALLGAISWLIWRARRQKPYLLTGWLWFLGMLVPVIGLVQQGLQAMADRYTYLPQIGVFIGVTFAIGDLAARLRLRPMILIPVAAFVLAGCLIATARQLRFWRNSETLFAHALAVTKDNHVAYFNFGVALYQRGRADEAINCFQEALEIQPNYAEAHNNLAAAFMNGGQVSEAVAHLRKALEIQPRYAEAYCNLGNAFLQMGQVDAATTYYQKALEFQPDFAGAHNNLGITFLQQGQVGAAIAEFQQALKIDPRFAPAHNSLGAVLLQRGQLDEAIVHYRKASEMEPDSVQAHVGLGNALLQKGQADQAIFHYQKVLENQPQNVEVLNNFARVLATSPQASLRNGAKAIDLAQQADRLSGSKNPAILSTLAAAYAEGGHFAEALGAARRALQLAAAQNNVAWVHVLRAEIGFYEAGSPFRDTSLTNALPAQSRGAVVGAK